MLSKVYSCGVMGIEGFEVCVECSAWNRVPSFELVGLSDAAVKEAKNRVQSACENSGLRFPSLDIMVNLAPADVKKAGTALDVAIILAILQHSGSLKALCDIKNLLDGKSILEEFVAFVDIFKRKYSLEEIIDVFCV